MVNNAYLRAELEQSRLSLNRILNDCDKLELMLVRLERASIHPFEREDTIDAYHEHMDWHEQMRLDDEGDTDTVDEPLQCVVCGGQWKGCTYPADTVQSVEEIVEPADTQPACPHCFADTCGIEEHEPYISRFDGGWYCPTCRMGVEEIVGE